MPTGIYNSPNRRGGVKGRSGVYLHTKEHMDKITKNPVRNKKISVKAIGKVHKPQQGFRKGHKLFRGVISNKERVESSARMIRTMLNMPRKDTLPERLFEHLLMSKNIIYEKQKRLPNTKSFTIADFYIPDTNTAIYVDGDYWHKYPDGQESDRNITNKLLILGYNVRRFWEHDIVKNIDSIVI